MVKLQAAGSGQAALARRAPCPSVGTGGCRGGSARKGAIVYRYRIELISLLVLVQCTAAPENKSPSPDVDSGDSRRVVGAWPGPVVPSGEWDGTSPACSGNCDQGHVAWCTGTKPPGPKNAYIGCSYSKGVTKPPGFGNPCSYGRKAFCFSPAEFPGRLSNAADLKSCGAYWDGTAPFCKGECEVGYFALCRSVDGSLPCSYSDWVNMPEEIFDDFGSACWSPHRKVYCVPIDYLDAPLLQPAPPSGCPYDGLSPHS